MLNIMNPPADWSTMKKLIWLRGTPISGGEELTVSGTPPLSLPNSLGKPLKAWSVDVLPYQEGSGDPAPDNVRPIHGTDKVTITTAGENLFDGRIEQGNFNQFGLNVPDNTRLRTIGFIPVMAGSTITVTYVGAKFTAFAISGYVDSEYTTRRTQSTPWLTNGTSTTIDLGIKYVRINFRAASEQTDVQPSDISEVMVNFGNTALPFTPYLAPSQTVITLPSTVYTATIGSDGGESRQGKIVLDGSETWTLSAQAGSFYTPLHAMKKWRSYADDRIMCDKLLPCAYHSSSEYLQAENAVTGYADFNDSYPNQNWIYAKANNCTTVTEFKAWLAENPITVVYDLADPVQFPLTTSDIPTPKGTATTWATAEDGTVDGMEVTYVGKA